jgi:hypothetical protein
MKAPGDKRNTWKDGIIQVMVTRACDLHCTHCTQGSNLAGKPVVMSVAQFEEACASLIDYYGVVGVFGGNPCVHPAFEQIARTIQRIIPYERRGLWSNNLMGYGKLCREIFNPEVSNLNVHMNYKAYMEMLRDWPECHPKGANDSRHSPPFVALVDMDDLTISDKWALINKCDINQYWSAMIGVFRGELRAWFCELAGSQSMLHEKEQDYPDTGVKIFSGWWRSSLEMFEEQIYRHCFTCGIPLKGLGDLAMHGQVEQYSASHVNIMKLKKPGSRDLVMIKLRRELGGEVPRATDYIENGAIR